MPNWPIMQCNVSVGWTCKQIFIINLAGWNERAKRRTLVGTREGNYGWSYLQPVQSQGHIEFELFHRIALLAYDTYNQRRVASLHCTSLTWRFKCEQMQYALWTQMPVQRRLFIDKLSSARSARDCPVWAGCVCGMPQVHRLSADHNWSDV